MYTQAEKQTNKHKNIQTAHYGITANDGLTKAKQHAQDEFIYQDPSGLLRAHLSS